MYGDDMGTLNVLVKDETGANIVSWSKSGNQGELWYGEVIEIQSTVGTRERRWLPRNAAIDNVTITEGSCATDRIPHRCTFEINDQCFLRQETDDDFDWKLPQSGITYTTNTGPSSAMEGDSYAYIEATFTNNCDVAVLSSDSLTLDDPFCLTFAYHMYGNNMGKLKLLIRDETGLDVITWSKTGNKGDEWHNLKIEIPPSVPSSLKRKIIFQGVRGDGHRSDVAIDNIILTPGTCGNSLISLVQSSAFTYLQTSFYIESVIVYNLFLVEQNQCKITVYISRNNRH
ncbi:MAM domain-containing glycosylphosphatidylinositol anchor protein 1-like [Argopecten irradians]|uniref:MAM domain-containing glycosylphosphatidylinositol anchor protein 1-like n=1 Tax=Argopecten irradians TaxID=31199 RepID=UPI00371B247A